AGAGIEAYDVCTAATRDMNDIALGAQLVLVSYFAVSAQVEIDDIDEPLYCVSQGWLNQLALYPVFAWTTGPSFASLGLAAETGVNVSLSVAALRGTGYQRQRAGFWVSEILLSAPQVAIMSYQLTRPTDDWSTPDVLSVANG